MREKAPDDGSNDDLLVSWKDIAAYCRSVGHSWPESLRSLP
jgi:hypothetical protein